jgi:hypothetical protein
MIASQVRLLLQSGMAFIHPKLISVFHFVLIALPNFESNSMSTDIATLVYPTAFTLKLGSCIYLPLFTMTPNLTSR